MRLESYPDRRRSRLNDNQIAAIVYPLCGIETFLCDSDGMKAFFISTESLTRSRSIVCYLLGDPNVRNYWNYRTGGRIVTTGSVNADRAGFPGFSVYSATKAAVAGLTRGMARDLGSRGITVNVIQPGPIETADILLRHPVTCSLNLMGTVFSQLI